MVFSIYILGGLKYLDLPLVFYSILVAGKYYGVRKKGEEESCAISRGLVLKQRYRARVQYEMTQHPKLATQLPASLTEILQIALQSHREALSLQQDNTDILFNTAQVLTSLAEVVTEGKRHSEQQTHDGLASLQEALELLQRCLALQELRLTESQEQISAMEENASSAEPVGDDEAMVETQGGPSETSDSPQQEQWASVIEPITKSTLVDTAIAQLETLATLCGLLTFEHGSVVA